MTRLPRYVIPGIPQHIIQRGNNRSAIFFSEKDYLFYSEKLLQASQEHGCIIHAYVLMTNHVHLLATPLYECSISKMQQMIGRYYVQYFNYQYQRTGTLWEGRYRATLVDTKQYLFRCMHYIEMNPVRAGMVKEPGNYRWSSYSHNALGVNNALITPHEEYLSLGKTYSDRQEAYVKLCATLLSSMDLNHIREMTNKGWVLGTTAFKEEIESISNRPIEPVLKGGDRRSRQYQEKINRV